MKFRSLPCLFALAALLGFVPRASAHIQITSPTPREINASGAIKSGPCGPDPKPATAPAANAFKPGATVVVNWTEVIGHSGWFRLALDPNGQAGFVDPAKATFDAFKINMNDPTLTPVTTTTQSGAMWILSDYLYKHASAASGTKRTTTITLPNVTCDQCTLQLIQVMTDHTWDATAPTNGNGVRYYHCVDLTVSNSAPGTGGASGSAGAGGSGGKGGAAGTGTGGTAGTGSEGGTQGTAGSGTTGGDGGDSGSAGDAGGSGAAGDGAGGGSTRRASGGCSFASSRGGPTGALVLLIAGLLYFRPGRRRKPSP